jgi:single stranded DNA-binding protein
MTMSEGHASATVNGNLGRDPETRQAGSSTVTRFSIGVSKRRKQKDGSYSFEPNWYEAEVWGSRGTALAKFLKKGASVTASGDQFVRTYQKRDGTTGFAIELGSATVTPGPRADSASRQAPARDDTTSSEPDADDVESDGCFPGDDIPF